MRSRTTPVKSKRRDGEFKVSPYKVVRALLVLWVFYIVYSWWTNPTISSYWCDRRYDKERGSKKRKSDSLPPVLYSLSGTGTKWLRLFVEYATSSNTGSIHNDGGSSTLFKWDQRCDNTVSMVLANPLKIAWAGPNSISRGLYNGAKTFKKCYRNPLNPETRFSRVIVLLRDPYDTVFTQYERIQTQSDVGRLHISQFDEYNWQEWASYLSHQYLNLLEGDSGIGGARNSEEPNSWYVVRYEALKEGDDKAMMNLMNFIDPEESLPPRRPSLMSSGDKSRLQCARLLADDKLPTAPPLDDKVHVTPKLVYKDPRFICAMWAVFGKAVSKYGYKIRDNVDCNEINYFTALRDVPDPARLPAKAVDPAIRETELHSGVTDGNGHELPLPQYQVTSRYDRRYKKAIFITPENDNRPIQKKEQPKKPGRKEHKMTKQRATKIAKAKANIARKKQLNPEDD